MAKLKGLGRGLDALLGEDTVSSAEEPRVLPIHLLQPGKYQPRTRMDEASLDELSQSIRAHGLLQPILVRRLDEKRYEIIAGERRWRAAQRAGLNEVPVHVRSIPDESVLAVALIENIQRENLNPLEEAIGLDRLIREFGLTHESAAASVGKSRSAVTNLLRLLNLTDSVRLLLMDGHIEMGHARALLALPVDGQKKLGALVASKEWSVRETERKVQQMLADQKKPSALARKAKGRDVQVLENELSDHLGAQVTLKESRGGNGVLSIRYHSLDQLEGVLRLLRS